MTLRSIVAVFVLAITATAQSTAPLSGVAPGNYLFKTNGDYFVQIDVEQGSNGAPPSVKGRFLNLDPTFHIDLDYYRIAKGSLNGNELSFETHARKGTSFSFTGRVTRGHAISLYQDGYYEVSGRLTRTIVIKHKIPTAIQLETTIDLCASVTVTMSRVDGIFLRSEAALSISKWSLRTMMCTPNYGK